MGTNYLSNRSKRLYRLCATEIPEETPAPAATLVDTNDVHWYYRDTTSTEGSTVGSDVSPWPTQL
jgi:hypothetical protein